MALSDFLKVLFANAASTLYSFTEIHTHIKVTGGKYQGNTK